MDHISDVAYLDCNTERYSGNNNVGNGVWLAEIIQNVELEFGGYMPVEQGHQPSCSCTVFAGERFALETIEQPSIKFSDGVDRPGKYDTAAVAILAYQQDRSKQKGNAHS